MTKVRRAVLAGSTAAAFAATALIASASKLLRFGNELVNLGGGVRYWLDSPDSGAEGFGLRLTATLPFPR
jgi:hypothetical protein